MVDVLVNNAAVSHSAHDYTDDYTLGHDRSAEEIARTSPRRSSCRGCSWHGGGRTDSTIHRRPTAIMSTPGSLFPLEANPLYAATQGRVAQLHAGAALAAARLARLDGRGVPAGAGDRIVEGVDVLAEADNGPQAVVDVAKASVEGILAGERTVLPHPQSEQLYAAFGRDFSDNFMAKLNSGGRPRDPGTARRPEGRQTTLLQTQHPAHHERRPRRPRDLRATAAAINRDPPPRPHRRRRHAVRRAASAPTRSARRAGRRSSPARTTTSTA